MKTHAQKGWPPDGSPGEWLGWDADGRLCILRWQPAPANHAFDAAWIGVRFDPKNALPGSDAAKLDMRQWPMGFCRGKDTEHFVVQHRPAVGARGE